MVRVGGLTGCGCEAGKGGLALRAAERRDCGFEEVDEDAVEMSVAGSGWAGAVVGDVRLGDSDANGCLAITASAPDVI